MKLSFAFELQLVPFVFSLILGDPLIVSLPQSKNFHGRIFFFFFLEVGINLWGIVLHSGTTDRIMPRKGRVSKNTFSFDLIKVNHKCL